VKCKRNHATNLCSHPQAVSGRCDVVRCVSRRRGNRDRQRPVVPWWCSTTSQRLRLDDLSETELTATLSVSTRYVRWYMLAATIRASNIVISSEYIARRTSEPAIACNQSINQSINRQPASVSLSLIIWVYIHSNFSSGLQNTHLFCNGVRICLSRSSKVWYQLKVCLQSPISPSL